MAAKLEVDHICDTDVDHTQKTLIPFLELALVEDLDGNDGGIFHETETGQQPDTQTQKCQTYISKLSFQYGFRVFLITLVVCVCSASTVMTAKGSGKRKTSRFERPSAATTNRSEEASSPPLSAALTRNPDLFPAFAVRLARRT